MASKRPRSSSFGSQMLPASGSGRVVVRGKGTYGFRRSARKERKGILWLDRTVAKGLSFPQANTFPVGQVVQLHYNVVSNISSTGTAGTFVPEVFYRLNDIYDPVVAVGGAQPYYYDTLFGNNGSSAPYYSWRVLRTRINIQFYNDNTGSGAAMMAGAAIGVGLNGTNGTVAASQLLMQRPNARTIPSSVMTGPQGTAGFSIWVDHAKMYGVRDMKDADDQIGLYNSSPAGTPLHLDLFAFPIDTGSISGAEIWYRLHITYYVECRQLNTVAES